jgi:hypothetical protein
VDDVRDPRRLRRVDGHLRLHEHLHGVGGEQEYAVDPREARSGGCRVIGIELAHLDAPLPQRGRRVGPAAGGDQTQPPGFVIDPTGRLATGHA